MGKIIVRVSVDRCEAVVDGVRCAGEAASGVWVDGSLVNTCGEHAEGTEHHAR